MGQLFNTIAPRVLLLCLTLGTLPLFAQNTGKENPPAKKQAIMPKKPTEMARDAAELDQSSMVVKVDTTKSLSVIAFGSCNKPQLYKDIWGAIAQNNPDLWIWLGDIIYADTADTKALAAQYLAFKKLPEYRKLTTKTPVIGVYDDHDYGCNDAGKGFPAKKGSKKCLMDFLDIPANAPVRKREGAYQSYTFGKGEQKIKIIVLDTRYFRDTLEKDPSGDRRYIPNDTGDILGETQWEWLEKELSEGKANLNILCSSIQVIADDHGHEKWGNFPNARKRLLSTIARSKPKNLLIISGDRHMAEVSKMDLTGLPYPLYDFTSSGLTHLRSGNSETNKFRVGDMIVKRNFGLIKVQWKGNKPSVVLEVRGPNNLLFQELHVDY